jgi:hypothetical protein
MSCEVMNKPHDLIDTKQRIVLKLFVPILIQISMLANRPSTCPKLPPSLAVQKLFNLMRVGSMASWIPFLS